LCGRRRVEALQVIGGHHQPRKGTVPVPPADDDQGGTLGLGVALQDHGKPRG
jgi:hypothetical protein